LEKYLGQGAMLAIFSKNMKADNINNNKTPANNQDKANTRKVKRALALAIANFLCSSAHSTISLYNTYNMHGA
jgi:hypothetical protein